MLLCVARHAEAGEDALAQPALDAVRVLTHHAAKDLGWPVATVRREKSAWPDRPPSVNTTLTHSDVSPDILGG